MTNSLSILIDIKERGAALLSSLENGLRRVDAAGRAYHATLAASNSASSSFAGSLGRIAAALGGVDLYRRAISSAFQYNNTLEQSQIGIAALIRSFNDFKDVNGRAVAASKAYAISIQMATKIQKDLQIAGLKTTATYEQLLRVMQEGLGPAFKAGFKPDEIVKFVSMMAQAGAALSVPMDQLGQEVRTILDGTIDQNARIAKALSISAKQMKEVISTGKGFEFLSAKLKEFELAGDDAAKTLSGSFSNLVDAIQMALGSGLTGAFENTKKLILDLTKAIVTIDSKTGSFTFNEKIVSALKRVDIAITEVLGNGKNIEAWVETGANAFADIAVACLAFADAVVKIVNAMGPFLPAIIQAITYLGLARIAFAVLVGTPLVIATQIRAMATAMSVLTAGSIVSWLATLRIALASVGAAATTAALAFKFVLVAAAAYAVMEIAKLVSGIYEYIKATKELKQAQQDAKAQSDFVDARVVDRLKAVSAATGMNIKSMKEFNKLVDEGALVWNKVNQQWAAATAGGTKVIPKPTVGVDEKGIADQKRLQEQLANDLIRLSGDKWTVLRNQAKKHYEDQVSMANGNQALILQAKKVYSLELARIAKDQAEIEGKEAKKSAEEQIKEQKRIADAMAESQAVRAKAATETALTILEDVYKRGEVSIANYFAKRKALIDQQFNAEIKELETKLKYETDEVSTLKLQDQILEAQERHKRDIINATSDQIDAEKKLAEAQEHINQILSNVSLRSTGRGDMTLDTTFAAELAQLDQQQAEEQARFAEQLKMVEDLNEKKALSDELYRLQKKEKDQLMLDQERRLAEARMDIAQSIAGTLSGMFEDLYEMSGKKSKEFFILAKAAAIAESIINTAQAVTKAYAQGGIFGMAQAAVLAAAGGVQIAKIQAQTLAAGGSVRGWSPSKRADNVPIWATAGEFMHPVDTVKYYGRGVMEALRRRIIPRDLFSSWNFSVPSPSSFALAGGGSVPSSGGASFMVSVPVTVSGVSNADKLARILPGEIEQTIIKVMRDQLR